MGCGYDGMWRPRVEKAFEVVEKEDFGSSKKQRGRIWRSRSYGFIWSYNIWSIKSQTGDDAFGPGIRNLVLFACQNPF